MSQIDHYAPSLFGAIAHEIRDMRALIEQLALTLAADEHFVNAYLEQFQVFDLVIQRADESADLLDRLADGTKSHEAVSRVRLDVVQARLRSALMAAG